MPPLIAARYTRIIDITLTLICRPLLLRCRYVYAITLRDAYAACCDAGAALTPLRDALILRYAIDILLPL